MGAVLGLALLSGCDSGSGSGAQERDDPTPTTAAPGPATPTSAAPSRSPAPASSPAPSHPSAAPARLGPDGYGALKLGMSRAEAKATGLITLKSLGGGPCTGFDLKSHPAGHDLVGGYISSHYGLVSISAVGNMRTPEGIGMWATRTQVEKAYPALRTGPNGSSAKVPGNAKASYMFLFDGQKVREMSLSLTMQDCFN